VYHLYVIVIYVYDPGKEDCAIHNTLDWITYKHCTGTLTV